MQMTTIHELRTNLESAQAAYLAADIEHPSALITAKDNLANARHEYWAACATHVEMHPEGLTTVDIATADARGYASGRESLVSLLRDLVALLDPAIGGIGNKTHSDNAESAVARAKEVIGSFEP